MGYKSLAQMPAHRNGPVSSNVRRHQNTTMAPDEHLINTYSGFTKAIFGPTKYEGVEFLGSGSVIRMEGKFYLFTAGHVLDRATDARPLFFSIGDRLVPISGTASNSRTIFPIRRSDDQIDLAVVELPDAHNDLLAKTSCLKISNLDVHALAVSEIGFLFMGYPISKNRQTVDKLTREIEPFLYVARCWEADSVAYQKLNLTKSQNLVLNFNNKRVYSREGEIRAAPALNGLSGAPIWGGTSSGAAVVVAILTAYHQGARKCIVSTRISLFYEALLELRHTTRDPQ